MMNPQRTVIDRIETALQARPSCPCGRETTAVFRDGAVWLDCTFVLEPAEGRVSRILAGLATPVHLHGWIVDVPQELAAAA